MDKAFLKYLEEESNFEKSLKFLNNTVKDRVVFSTSFGIEDQVITHAIFSQEIENIDVFTLDTGRLFAETYAVWDKTVLQYNKPIKAYYPNT